MRCAKYNGGVWDYGRIISDQANAAASGRIEWAIF